MNTEQTSRNPKISPQSQEDSHGQERGHLGRTRLEIGSPLVVVEAVQNEVVLRMMIAVHHQPAGAEALGLSRKISKTSGRSVSVACECVAALHRLSPALGAASPPGRHAPLVIGSEGVNAIGLKRGRPRAPVDCLLLCCASLGDLRLQGSDVRLATHFCVRAGRGLKSDPSGLKSESAASAGESRRRV